MALVIDPALPAYSALTGSNINSTGSKAARIKIAFVNLMPKKEETEIDFLRLMAPSDVIAEIKLVKMTTHRSKNTSAEHINRFYTSFDEALATGIDGVIITGAPLENVPFESVDYWNEITGIFDIIRLRRIPSLFICWAAFAALYHHHRLPWHIIDRKISGVYPHRILCTDYLTEGLTDGFLMPHSRYAVWDEEEIKRIPDIRVIAEGDRQGPYLSRSVSFPEYYITGHGEYHALTLDGEYRRDLAKGINPTIPENYYPDNDPDRTPTNRWHEEALLIMDNWLHCIADR